jgi:hypothetical protein
VNEQGCPGKTVKIPYVMSKPRQFKDQNTGDLCVAFDAIFNTATVTTGTELALD